MDAEQQLEIVLIAEFDCGGGCSWSLHTVNGERVPAVCWWVVCLSRSADGTLDLEWLSDNDDRAPDSDLPLLNPIGLQGWELVGAARAPEASYCQTYLTLRFRRPARSALLWEYARDVLWPLCFTTTKDRSPIATQLLREIYAGVDQAGWEIIAGLPLYPLGAQMVEVILKRPLAALGETGGLSRWLSGRPGPVGSLNFAPHLNI